jgi:hypothetical protein
LRIDNPCQLGKGRPATPWSFVVSAVGFGRTYTTPISSSVTAMTRVA